MLTFSWRCGYSLGLKIWRLATYVKQKMWIITIQFIFSFFTSSTVSMYGFYIENMEFQQSFLSDFSTTNLKMFCCTLKYYQCKFYIFEVLNSTKHLAKYVQWLYIQFKLDLNSVLIAEMSQLVPTVDMWGK